MQWFAYISRSPVLKGAVAERIRIQRSRWFHWISGNEMFYQHMEARRVEIYHLKTCCSGCKLCILAGDILTPDLYMWAWRCDFGPPLLMVSGDGQFVFVLRVLTFYPLLASIFVVKNTLFQIWMRRYQFVQCNSSTKGQLTSQIWSKPWRLSSSFNLWTNVWHLRGKDTFIDWLLYASYRAKCFHMHLVVAMKVLLSDFFFFYQRV